MKYPDYAKKIISRLEAAGESAYIVGGSVRDMLLGREPYDYDIATSALPEKTAELFSDMRVIATGLKHGTVTVMSGGHPVEITTYRIDGSYTDMRHPDGVEFTRDICADLARRDFTVNSMAYSEARGLVDIFGGREDMERRVLRAVGDPDERFAEDALRIMRAFRFCAQLGFAIEENTLAACARQAFRLGRIAKERIGTEFIRLLCSPQAGRALKHMKECGVLPYVMGEFSPQNIVIEKIGEMPPVDSARLGFLLVGAEEPLARAVLLSLRFSNKQLTGALAVRRGAQMSICGRADARKLLADVGIYAPYAAKASELLGRAGNGAYELTLREQSAPHGLRELAVNGKDIAALGVKGKQIGEILNTLLQCVLEEPEKNQREVLLGIARRLINKEEHYGRA